MSDIYGDFKNFLVDNDIIVTIIATILSSNVTTLTKSLMDNLIIPLINIDLNNDGKPDRENLESWVVDFRGAKIKIGKFLLTFIEFFFIMILIFFINKLSKK